jgi:hypothetical protein
MDPRHLESRKICTHCPRSCWTNKFFPSLDRIRRWSASWWTWRPLLEWKEEIELWDDWQCNGRSILCRLQYWWGVEVKDNFGMEWHWESHWTKVKRFAWNQWILWAEEGDEGWLSSLKRLKSISTLWLNCQSGMFKSFINQQSIKPYKIK